jgi:hypothetical protein
MQDWFAWHEPYADPASSLSRRLRTVQHHITDWLDSRPGGELYVLSLCAGQGQDIVGVLAARPDTARVRVDLVEADPRNAASARAAVEAAGLDRVSVHEADAGDLATYADFGRADLLLLVGVLGNVGDADLATTVAALPALCAPAATVIWTRHRRPPDRTPAVREMFTAAGFVERAFEAHDDVLYSVGVQQFAGVAAVRPASGRLFQFVPGSTTP